MKVCFDTSVLVAAVVDQLTNHESALDCFSRYSGRSHDGFCSTHALAECFATLTALPLPRRIQPVEASQLIQENFVNRLTVIEISRKRYLTSMERVSKLGLASGIIYDALHLECAEKTNCSRLYTYNLREFHKLQPEKVSITAP